MARKKKRGTRAQRVGAVAGALALVAAAERDLHGRPETEIRGSKRVWQLVSLNGLGALAYLAWGRRRR